MLKQLMLSSFFIAVLAILPPVATAAPGDPEAPETPTLPFSNDDAWTFDIDDQAGLARHDLTGFTCPFSLDGDYGLSEVVQYKMAGIDIGCNYVRRDRGAYITYSLSWYSNPADAKTQAEATIDGLKPIRALGERLNDGPAQSGIPGYEGACHQIDYEQTGEDSPTLTGARLCVSGRWVFKTRITRPLTEDDPARKDHFAAADASFGKYQSDFIKHQEHCGAANSADVKAEVINNEGATSAALVVSLLGAHRISSAADSEVTPPDISKYCTFFDASSDTHGYIFMQDPDNKLTPYALYKSDSYQRSSKPLVWIESQSASLGALLEIGENASFDGPKFALWGEVSDARQSLFRLYDGQPDYDQFTQDSADVLNGKIDSIVSISTDKDGDNTIELSLPDEE